MVKLNKIYTRTGDQGDTSLVTGERAAKHSPRIVAIGSIDETNAAIGVARAALKSESANGHFDATAFDKVLERIQNDLFDLGADIATPFDPPPESSGPALRIVDNQVARLEREIDNFNERLQPLKSFILPGGSPTAAALHFARTVCRRAERDMAALAALRPGNINGTALRYINRLSDLLFVMARSANDDGQSDHLWTPGENR